MDVTSKAISDYWGAFDVFSGLMFPPNSRSW